MTYHATALLALTLSFILSILGTLAARRFASAKGIVDAPSGGRKIHAEPIPLLGGLGIFGAVVISIGIFSATSTFLLHDYTHVAELLAITIGGAILMVGGYLDDKYQLSPRAQLIAPLLAITCLLIANVAVRSISNPFAGGYVSFGLDEVPVLLQPLMLAVTVAWMLGMMYTTKILDGLDGLVSGLAVIGSLVIFGVSQRPELFQQSVGLLALILAGSCAGFLLFNFNPAKVFLGEGGSLFVGFMLGTLSIMAGSKIATALLIMGIPILDLAWVMYCRLRAGQSIAVGDRRHLHHKFLEAGFSQRQTVIILYILVALFGVAAVFLQTKQKVIALVALAAVLVALGMWLMWRLRKRAQIC